MTIATFLPRGFHISRTNSFTLRLYHVGRASSVDTAIARGIRKSNGLGLRGKGKPAPDDAREKYRERNGIAEYAPKPREARATRQGESRQEWEGRGRRKETTEEPELRIRKWKKEINPEREFERERDSKPYSGRREAGNWEKLGDSRGSVAGRPRERQSYPSLDGDQKRQAFQSRGKEDQFSDDRRPLSSFSNQRADDSPKSQDGFRVDRLPAGFDRGHERSQDGVSSASRFSRNGFQSDSRRPSSFNRTQDADTPSPRSLSRSLSDTKSSPSSNNQTHSNSADFLPRPFDRHIPLSIPYTTPASEFLYGTSPILAALQSSRKPRRQLYKLYIYSTPQREDPTQDQTLVKLARRAGVPIEKVTGDGLRLLDKMSGGRPHNGYILEASPLPRVPVLSLGKVGAYGFEIVLGHQSREEAAVNGTESFISTPHLNVQKPRRNPLVLYLDSITDPGNLGGIIRTASFLGVTAIAISARNSAPFSPVVLKASAGAAENITIFSVDKPAGFIVDSKTTGWKVYAAVTPEKGVERPSVSAEKLDDPLVDGPVILMLGSEGEGLRWNLRVKADVDLYIRGSGGRGGVDSLNVSVATGILCNAFLRGQRKTYSRAAGTNKNAEKKDKLENTGVAASELDADSAAVEEQGVDENLNDREEVLVESAEKKEKENSNVLF